MSSVGVNDGRGLSWDIGLFGAVSTVVAGTLGAGLFVTLGTASSTTGLSVILAAVPSGLLAMNITLNYGQMATTFPGTARSYTYVSQVLDNHLLGFVVTRLKRLGYMVADAAVRLLDRGGVRARSRGRVFSAPRTGCKHLAASSGTSGAVTAPRLTSAVSDCTDVELATILEYTWRARGYQTHVRFRGPGIHVGAVGKMPESTKRGVRIWMTSTGTVTTNEADALIRRCKYASIEPYVAAIDGSHVAPDAHRPGLAVLGAPAVAVEICETGAESFIRDFAAEGGSTNDGKGRSLDSEGDDDDAEDPEDDETDENDTADRLTHREVLTRAGTYVAGGLVTYPAIEHVLDVVQQLPGLRAAVVRRVTWPGAHLPNMHLPPAEWSVPTPQSLSEESILPNRTTAVSTPTNATTIPYTGLRERPEAYTGTAVTYAGCVEGTMERGEVRLALVAVEDDWG